MEIERKGFPAGEEDGGCEKEGGEGACDSDGYSTLAGLLEYGELGLHAYREEEEYEAEDRHSLEDEGVGDGEEIAYCLALAHDGRA